MSHRRQRLRRNPASAKPIQNSVADSSIVPAPLLRRLAALLYDALLLAAVLVAATGLAMLCVALISGSTAAKDGGILTHNPFFQTYLLLVCFFFYAGFWVHGGQTLGMRAWRLRVQTQDGKPITWKQALLRFFSAGAWLLVLIAVYRIWQPSWSWNLISASSALFLLLWWRIPERCSATQLVLLPKKGAGDNE